MSREPPNFEQPERPSRSRREDEPTAKGRRYNTGLIFGIAAFAVVAVYAALMAITWADDYFFPGNEIRIGINLPGIDSGDNPAVADIEERINILVLGLDRRVDEVAEVPARTDTVFILTVDPFSKTAGILSIPRDLLVEIPDGNGDYFQDRINVAYEYGETDVVPDYPGGGPGLAIDTMEHNFNIPIDHYVVLDFNAFKALIDELGGIDIDVPAYVYDPSYSECQSGCPYYFVEYYPGPQHMDGQAALAYARLRYSDNDLLRIERQHLVMRAAVEKATTLNLFDIGEASSLYGKYKEAVDTDISDFQIPGLARLAQQIGTEQLETLSLREAVFPCGEGCGAAYLLADWEKVEELKARLFLDGRLQAERAVIEVQNGTGEPELATSFATFLMKQGLLPEAIAVADTFSEQFQAHTSIVSLNGKEFTARKLAEWLELSEDRIIKADDAEATPYLGRGVDIVVVLGADAGIPTTAIP